MKFTIDVIFADKNNAVIKVYPGLRPNRLTAVFFSASYAVELPAGTIHSTQTKEGDILVIR